MAKKLYFKPIARLTFATDVVDQNRKIGKEWCPAWMWSQVCAWGW